VSAVKGGALAPVAAVGGRLAPSARMAFVGVQPSDGPRFLRLRIGKTSEPRASRPVQAGIPTSCFRVVVFLAFWCAGSLVHAAVPSLSHLFPAGGRQGTSFPVTLGGKFDGERAGVWVSGDGVSISAPDKTGNATATISADATTGLRLVRAFNAEGASAVRWFSVGVVPEAQEKEPNDALDTGGKLDKLPVCVNGVLEKSGDIDGFTFQAEAGREIVASVEAYALGSPVDAVVNLFDEQGVRVAAAHDGRNLDPFLVWKAAKTGRYTLQISGFTHPPAADVRFTGGSADVYRLVITTDPVVTQLLPAVVPSGVKSRVELRGFNLGKIDPAFEIDGTKLAAGQTVQLLQLPKWSTGPMQIVASSTVPVTEKEPNNTAAEAMLVGLPCAAGGTISAAGDVDRYAFQAKKGERIVVRVRSKALGLPLDASARIESSDGKVIASNDDQGDSPDPLAGFTVPADGTYQAVVTDLFNKGGPMHDYVVEIGPEPSDFDVSLTSEATIKLVAGTTAELKAKVKRTGGFAGTLVASVEGLPEGVMADSAVVDEKKGEVKLSLIAAGSATGFSGAVRLGVFSKDTKPVVHRNAAFDLRGESKRGTTLLDTSDAIWLTVTPAKPATAKKSPPPVLGAVPK